MNHIEWRSLIVNYLFLGGLSAGLYFVSALATLLRCEDRPAYTRVAAWGALIAPWPVMLGCFLLIFDLGRWSRFYLLFLHVRLTSPMSIGSWLLLGFSFLSLLYLYSWLSPASRERLFAWIPKRMRFLKRLDRDLSSLRRPLAIAGLPLSIGVGIYTGVLLGAVQSRPFWNTSLVAQMFLFSALSSGCAALLLALLWDRDSFRIEDIRLLYILDLCFLTLEFFIVLPYIIHGQLSVHAARESMNLILGGPFTVAFWLYFFTVGLVLPLILEAAEVVPALLTKVSAHYSKPLAALSAVLVLAGGFVLRYVFVYAGQMSAFR